MDHGYYKDRLSALFDGELKHEEEELIRRHVDDCPECREILASLERFNELSLRHRDLDENEYFDRLADKIDRAVAGEKATAVTDISRGTGKGLSWKMITVAASILVVGTIAIYESRVFDTIEQKRSSPLTQPQDAPAIDSAFERSDEIPRRTQSPATSVKRQLEERSQQTDERDEAADRPALHSNEGVPEAADVLTAPASKALPEPPADKRIRAAQEEFAEAADGSKTTQPTPGKGEQKSSLAATPEPPSIAVPDRRTPVMIDSLPKGPAQFATREAAELERRSALPFSDSAGVHAALDSLTLERARTMAAALLSPPAKSDSPAITGYAQSPQITDLAPGPESLLAVAKLARDGADAEQRQKAHEYLKTLASGGRSDMSAMARNLLKAIGGD